MENVTENSKLHEYSIYLQKKVCDEITCFYFYMKKIPKRSEMIYIPRDYNSEAESLVSWTVDQNLQSVLLNSL